MRVMRYDNNTREKVVELVKYHDATIEPKYKYIRRWLNRLGEEQFRRLLNIRVADIMAQKRILNDERLYRVALALKLTDEILTAEECFTLKDLAINGKDLLALGIPEGKEIGRILNQLLDMVMDDEIKNDKDELLKFVNNL
jgi:tRNA nucleotidyltransferase (CCA-adding enzyme)